MAYEQQRQYKTEIKPRKRKWHQVLKNISLGTMNRECLITQWTMATTQVLLQIRARYIIRKQLRGASADVQTQRLPELKLDPKIKRNIPEEVLFLKQSVEFS